MKQIQSPYFKLSPASALLLALVTVSCSANQSPEDATKKREFVVAEEQPAAEPLTAADDSAPGNKMIKMTRDEQILFARQDLAKRLNVDLDQVRLSGAVDVTWRSGALGCPKPGMQYTQALVPGVSMMLVVDKSVYRYHAKTAGEPFHCPDQFAEPPSVSEADI